MRILSLLCLFSQSSVVSPVISLMRFPLPGFSAAPLEAGCGTLSPWFSPALWRPVPCRKPRIETCVGGKGSEACPLIPIFRVVCGVLLCVGYFLVAGPVLVPRTASREGWMRPPEAHHLAGDLDKQTATGQRALDVAEVSPGCQGSPEQEVEVGWREGSVNLELNGKGSVGVSHPSRDWGHPGEV